MADRKAVKVKYQRRREKFSYTSSSCFPLSLSLILKIQYLRHVENDRSEESSRKTTNFFIRFFLHNDDVESLKGTKFYRTVDLSALVNFH